MVDTKAQAIGFRSIYVEDLLHQNQLRSLLERRPWAASRDFDSVVWRQTWKSEFCWGLRTSDSGLGCGDKEPVAAP